MNLEYLKQVVNNRTVFIFAHGCSIQELEYYIDKLKDQNICFVGLGLFTIFEQYILSKINKKLDIVFDCATVPHARLDHYERIRLPRIYEFLNRPDHNLWITTHGLIRDSVQPLMPELLINFQNKILKVDSLFPQDQIPFWMDVPNSMTLCIGAMIASGTKKIFLFGLDGYSGDISKGLDSYYQKEAHIKERIAALGSWEDPGINRDTEGFQNRFPQILQNYYRLFKNPGHIYNCSPCSAYKIPVKISYENLNYYLGE